MANLSTDQLLAIGRDHHRAGRLDVAENYYRQILARIPNHAEAVHMLGVIALQVGRGDLAATLIERSLQHAPGNPVALKNLSAALRAANRITDAVNAARAALQILPNDADAWGNLGNALADLGRLPEAVDAQRRVVELRPNRAQDWSNLGTCLLDIGKVDEAIAAHRRAVALAPDLAPAHWNLALALLAAGNFEGWREYEWRWKFDGFLSKRRNFPQPLWDGTPLNGRRLLLHAEQGFGDTFQFIRYVPRVAERAGAGATIYLECQPRVVSLFRQFPEVAAIIPAGEPLPEFDVHAPLLSLPLILGDSPESIPRGVPYLNADPNLIDAWKLRFAPYQGNFKIGLAWRGSVNNPQLRHRAISLAKLAPLATVSGVSFFSLQLDAASELASNAFSNLIDHTADQTDFAQTAACIAHLDLVISIDTAVAHLAGAMNKPTWILLPLVTEWRWPPGREDSAWYPAVRLFRQRTQGQWEEPVARICQELSNFSERR
jgi:Flp pilus assembly protein TadD